jgi:hypothetical protein
MARPIDSVKAPDRLAGTCTKCVFAKTKTIGEAMTNQEYAQLPGSNFEVRDVTETFGPTMARYLRSDGVVKNLRFPRLRFPLLRSYGYSPSDYHWIADHIGPGKIEVYETRRDELFRGKYVSLGELNFFVLTPSVTIAPLASMDTIVHEATHAIQDWKKMRASLQDMELDAHFAAALYFVQSGKDASAAALHLARFIIAAKAYNADARYLRSLEFRKARGKLESEILTHYRDMNGIIDDTFDPQAWVTAFQRRRRLDGVPH